jgi:hypothetical protein
MAESVDNPANSVEAELGGDADLGVRAQVEIG